MEDKKEFVILEEGTYWRCENMDLLAPITEKGNIYMSINGDRITDNELMEYTTVRHCTEEERKDAYHKFGFIFKNDTVVIVKGRKIPIGTTKVVKCFSKYEVSGTYGHIFTDYVHFTDGTKCNIQNVRVIGYENIDYVLEYFKLQVGGRL